MSSHLVQFLGLVLFLYEEKPPQALLGDFTNEMVAHDRFLAIPHGGIKSSTWPAPFTQITNQNVVWDVWRLMGGSRIQFNASGPAPTFPTAPNERWLSSLKLDCCEDFTLAPDPNTTVLVNLDHGTARCARDGSRIDTVVAMTVDGDLQIMNKRNGGEATTITCSGDAPVVIGNSPLAYFDDNGSGTTPPHNFDHYRLYYKLGRGGGCADTPANPGNHPRCKSHTQCANPVQPPMRASHRHESWLMRLFSGTGKLNREGVQIDCSNSTYP